MGTSTSFLKGTIMGAGAMYLLDPTRGRRRRGMLRDQLVRANRKLDTGLDAAARDARNRSKGVAARARRRLRGDEGADPVIEERVRAAMGRVVSHPGAIEVVAEDGRVTLTGPVLAHEADALLERTASVRGVDEVVDRLEVHETPGNTPGLQGQARPRQPRSEVMQENWTPALRLLAGVAGATLLLRGARSPGVAGIAATALGGGLFARAATNVPTRRLVGVNAGREALTFQKSLRVDAPLDDVWALWSRFENFPRFMGHLEEVRVLDDGRSHWVARGPGHTRFEWHAEITRWSPREVIAWKSVEGDTIATTGRVRFQPDDGGTRVDVHLSYTPPAGALGHAVASLFRSDPKHALDEDMVRLKSLLEEGRASAPGKQATREAVLSDTGG